jgi:hypothetical protein
MHLIDVSVVIGVMAPKNMYSQKRVPFPEVEASRYDAPKDKTGTYIVFITFISHYKYQLLLNH